MSHPDILDQHESLRGPLAGSVALHGLIVALAVIYAIAGAPRFEKWGDSDALGGGSVGITPVSRIPLPSRQGRLNPLANDTESQAAPAPPKPQAAPQTKAPEPDAIALKGRAKKPTERASTQKFKPETTPDQLRSQTGPAAVSPAFSISGSGEVGSGQGSVFGTRFGAYMQVLRDKIARNWRSNELDARIPGASVVVFEIRRDGSLGDIRVLQSSGNFAMDQSSQRAIMASAPFNPLPAGYEYNSVNIDLTFRLRR
jgi:protein TonB